MSCHVLRDGVGGRIPCRGKTKDGIGFDGNRLHCCVLLVGVMKRRLINRVHHGYDGLSSPVTWTQSECVISRFSDGGLQDT